MHVDYDPQPGLHDRGKPTKTRPEHETFVATRIGVIVFSDNQNFTPGHRPRPTADTVSFSGVAEWNRDRTKACTFTVNATDQGEPGKKAGEVFGVTINCQGGKSVTVHATSLTGGNIQSMRVKH